MLQYSFLFVVSYFLKQKALKKLFRICWIKNTKHTIQNKKMNEEQEENTEKAM